MHHLASVHIWQVLSVSMCSMHIGHCTLNIGNWTWTLDIGNWMCWIWCPACADLPVCGRWLAVPVQHAHEWWCYVNSVALCVCANLAACGQCKCWFRCYVQACIIFKSVAQEHQYNSSTMWRKKPNEMLVQCTCSSFVIHQYDTGVIWSASSPNCKRFRLFFVVFH